jgi:glycosyltransferase involved in cell wall biosynthesis
MRRLSIPAPPFSPTKMHLFINALAASAGGGLTYLRNVIPHLATRDDTRTTVLLSGKLQREFSESTNVSILPADDFPQIARRFWFEQRAVPRFIRQSGADVLLSTGNFAIRNPTVPQILLSRNALYTSGHFEADLRARGEFSLRIDHRLKKAVAKWSIGAADCTVAPSEAFAQELREWTGREITAIHHGFDRDAFVRDTAPLPVAVQEQLDSKNGALRILFVSHYNYYRNFETLFRAIRLIKLKLAPRKVKLFLTCQLAPGANPGSYSAGFAAALVRDLGISNQIVELGAVPYKSLHQLYRSADVYVSPAYAESFAHPLVEAMSSGLPVVASSLAIHKEICGPAALFFETFSPQELADRVVAVAQSQALRAELSRAGYERSMAFSWKNHVERIIGLAKSLMPLG